MNDVRCKIFVGMLPKFLELSHSKLIYLICSCMASKIPLCKARASTSNTWFFPSLYVHALIGLQLMTPTAAEEEQFEPVEHNSLYNSFFQFTVRPEWAKK